MVEVPPEGGVVVGGVACAVPESCCAEIIRHEFDIERKIDYQTELLVLLLQHFNIPVPTPPVEEG